MAILIRQVERQLWAASVLWLLDGDSAVLVGAARSMEDGTYWGPAKPRTKMAESETGAVYGLFADVRKRAGVLKAKEKANVKFKVRSADELADRLRPLLNELGLLIYPIAVLGKGEVVEGDRPGKSGTLAEATVTLRVRALVDGSYFDIEGFGLGADTQDKAGGKAGTYAWKTALVQALTAGGEKDTDDEGEPIKGGVRKPRPAAIDAPATTIDIVKAAIEVAKLEKDMSQLKAALAQARTLSAPDQAELTPIIQAAAAEIKGAA